MGDSAIVPADKRGTIRVIKFQPKKTYWVIHIQYPDGWRMMGDKYKTMHEAIEACSTFVNRGQNCNVEELEEDK